MLANLMSTRSETSPQNGPKLESLTANALKADKAAGAAKVKARLAKARLKAAKGEFKAAKDGFKGSKKVARKAAKEAKRARKALQICLERTARQRKKARKRPARLKSAVAREKGSAITPKERPAALSPPANSA
jgi:hypothetical protein